MNPVWIIGPCSMESKDFYFRTALEMSKILQGRDWYYKASFDKANRTALHGKRGPGLDQALDWFKEIKDRIPNIKLTTDIHETWQAEKLKGLVECIQIPAFLCRQTDLLAESGRHFKIVNIKKGQWINPDSTKHFISKVRQHNPAAEVWITERGTFFGYNQLSVDLGAVEAMKRHYDRVIMDCTHSTQRQKGDFTGGHRGLAERYMAAAPVFGYNGIFAEVHPNPPCALSDADCQIYLNRLPTLLKIHDDIKAQIDKVNIWDY